MISDSHLLHLILQVSSMCHTFNCSMTLASNSCTTLWTSRKLHWHTTFSNREEMAVGATIPIPCPSELLTHDVEDSLHLLWQQNVM